MHGGSTEVIFAAKWPVGRCKSHSCAAGFFRHSWRGAVGHAAEAPAKPIGQAPNRAYGRMRDECGLSCGAGLPFKEDGEAEGVGKWPSSTLSNSPQREKE
jgi:hypothetical protein